MGMQSIDIFGFKSGVQKKNKKPFLFVDDAFQNLENAYCFRDEIKKREGLQFIGRFRRFFQSASIGNSGASAWTINTLYSNYTPAITPEATAEIEPGSVVITIHAGPDIVFTDQGNGLLTSPTANNSGYINYLTGVVVLTHTAGAGVATDASFAYFPTLPAMGIPQREISSINDEQTLWFDTKYCYINTGGDFFEYLSPSNSATWNGTNSDFFWGTNYRGVNPQTRLFFETNFYVDTVNIPAQSPMRYTDGATWTDFYPAVSSTQFLLTARILIPYYGRLLALNCWEGPSQTDWSTGVNIFNRCRFSQIGDPVDQTNGWRSDQFGRGGFIDAPVNEEITNATFYKNTLIVFFERSTWRLQYLGEYGLPFIWERISSDWGSESTFSPVLFDNGVIAVGDKALIASNGGNVERIDLQIPDEVYQFKNEDNGTKRVQGIRDFKKELVYWCFIENDIQLTTQIYPNKTLLYNYRNNTFAFFRNSVTCYGNFQYQNNISWDRTDVFWDNPLVSWDTSEQAKMPLIVSGNQQGFAHFYGYPDVEANPDSSIDALDQESLSVTDVTVTSVVTLRIRDHNLSNGEIIYLTGLNYVVTTSPPTAGSTTLNDFIYQVAVVDVDNITIQLWSQDLQQYVTNFTVTNVGTYMGGGVVALFPNINIQTKDFNPIKEALGENIKTSYIDFLFDASTPSPINVKMIMNTDLNTEGNLTIGNHNVETSNSKAGYIYNVTQDNPGDPVIITSYNHGLLTGDEISPQQVGGATELNGNSYVITFLTVNSFSVEENTVSTYTSGGFWTQNQEQFFSLSALYTWHRFFATCFGQYFSLILSYSDEQMAQLSTHQQNFVLNAMKIWYRPGGKNIFGR